MEVTEAESIEARCFDRNVGTGGYHVGRSASGRGDSAYGCRFQETSSINNQHWGSPFAEMAPRTRRFAGMFKLAPNGR
jgi:hypothetical protein